MELDAVTVDAAHYAVEFENDQVRVIRISYGPHEQSVMHSHRAGAMVFLTDQDVRFTFPDGTTEEISAKAGETGWMEAVTHLPENLSDDRLELIYVEIK